MTYKILLTLLLLVLPAAAPLLRPGFFPMQDKMQYFRLYQLDQCLSDLQIPCRWVADLGYGYGYPLFNFYPPLPFYLGVLFRLVGLQYIDIIKLLFAASIILSAFSLYVLIWRLSRRAPAALVAAVLYAYLPFRATQVYVRGALNETFSYVFLPLILLFLYSLSRSPRRRHWLLLSLAFCAQLLTHNLVLLTFLPLLFLWFVYCLATSARKLAYVKLSSIAAFLGFGMAAFFLLPMLFEGRHAHLHSLTSGYFGYQQHFVSLRQLFFSNHFGYGSSQLGPDDDLSLSVGLAPLLALLLFFPLAMFSPVRLPLFIFAATVLFAAFMSHSRSQPLWSWLPFLPFLQFPWRFILVASLGLCAAAGLAISLFRRLRPALLFALILLPLLLHAAFFAPRSWLDTSDYQLLSDPAEVAAQATASIFDYLPISAAAPPATPAPPLPEVLSGSAQILSFARRSSAQVAQVSVTSPAARLRFPFFDFPGVTVSLNRAPWPHLSTDCSLQPFCYGAVSVDVPSGVHQLSVRLVDTPIRTASNLLSLASVVLFLFLCLKKRSC